MAKRSAFFHVFSRAAACVAFLALSSCASANVNPPLRPCVEVRERKAPPICEAGEPADRCAADVAFVRKQLASTVFVWVARYKPDIGMTYWSGTGAVIDAKGRVLTAEHVVSDAIWVSIGTRRLSDDGKDFVRVRDVPMRVVAASPEHDVALLEPSTVEKMPPPMPLVAAGRTFSPGETLWQFGNTSYWRRGGFIKAGVDVGPLTGLLKVDIESDGGDSGGPLVTSQGEVAGVLSRDDKFGTAPTYFVPLDVALAALGYER